VNNTVACKWENNNNNLRWSSLRKTTVETSYMQKYWCTAVEKMKEKSRQQLPWKTFAKAQPVHSNLSHSTAKCLSDTERWHFWMQYFSHAHMLLVMLGQQYQCKTAKQCNVSYVITDIISDICRAFSLAGPAAWNSLPDYLQDPSRSFNSFRRDLKTFPVSFY